MKFNDDFNLSLKARSIQDDIYIKVFKPVKIKRFENDEKFVLDREFHIDVQLELTNGVVITFQEKALRNIFSGFNTFTLEYMQNRHTGEKGEFFNLASQFYLHGYFNKEETTLEKWYIIRVPDFMIWIKPENFSIRPSTSNANFLSVNYNILPISVIFKSFRDF